MLSYLSYALQKYVKRRGLLLPKYVRKAAWRLMIRAMPREVARFIQSRFGELKIKDIRGQIRRPTKRG